MRITINQTDGTLPVIDELPPFGIGQLEGYNGVGKSLTVSILEICAGVRPRMEKEAWRGLCEGMGHIVVKATELNDLSELEWVLDGALLWEASGSADASSAPLLDWFVDVRADRHSVQALENIRPFFAVERVNGDVGLIQELAERAEAAARDVDDFAATLLASEKLASVEQRVGALRRLLEELSVERISERSALATRHVKELAAAEEVMSRAIERLERLEEVQRLRTRLEEISLRGSDLDRTIADLDERIRTMSVERRAIDRDLAAAEKAAAQSSGLRKELAAAARSYQYASTRLRNVTGDLARANQIAGIDDESDPAARRHEIDEHLTELRRERLEVDSGPAVVDLIDHVTPQLTHAVGSGLGDQTLLLNPSRPSNAWTVAEVAEGLVLRRDQVAAMPGSHEAKHIDEQIEALSMQLAALSDVDRLRDQRQKAIDKQNEAQETSQTLSEQLDSSSTARLEALREARRKLDDDLSAWGGERAVQVYRRDALGAPKERDALSQRLAELLSKLGLTEGQVDAAHAGALRAAEHERDAWVQLRDLAHSASAESERDAADVDRAITALSSDTAFGWVGDAAPTSSSIKEPLPEKLQHVARLQRLAARSDQRLTDFRQLFPGLGAGLIAVAEQLRGRTPKAAAHVDDVRRWLEVDAGKWFADDDFRDALLGDNARDVEVDLTSRQVVWTNHDGARHTKPIEALSSGERAFAFTQARLALLQRRAGIVSNRLIALDEFGAFVSANRVRQLAEYLRRWREEHQGDQILVILPANQDYAALARASEGTRAVRYERMAEALQQREWFVEEFDAA
jgi:DNA repair exonuclease SbcCD ATPase subunit